MNARTSVILPVNIALVAIGLLDLLTTLLWLRTGHAVEINPIMAAVLRAGIGAFIGLKLSTLGAYVLVMEWYRRRRGASFADIVGRITLSSYIVIYAVSFACVNHGLLFG